MPYGPIVSDEVRAQYRITGRIDTEDGAAAVNINIDVEYGEPAFLPVADATVQEIMDALSDVANLDLTPSAKFWTSKRDITPTP
jgi:hypothetical protein